jgi:hypothetical protein
MEFMRFNCLGGNAGAKQSLRLFAVAADSFCPAGEFYIFEV